MKKFIGLFALAGGLAARSFVITAARSLVIAGAAVVGLSALSASPALAQNMPPVIDLPVVSQVIQTDPLPLRVQQGGVLVVDLRGIFSDPDGDTLTYAASTGAAPPGATFDISVAQNQAEARFTFPADAPLSDQYFPELSATDGVNPTTTRGFLQIQVFAPGTIPSANDLVIEITGNAGGAETTWTFSGGPVTTYPAIRA